MRCKLFTKFIKDYNPDMVFSYCDFNKFDGKSYNIGYMILDPQMFTTAAPNVKAAIEGKKNLNFIIRDAD